MMQHTLLKYKQILLNIISAVILVCMLYNLLSRFTILGFFSFMFFGMISFSVASFILDKCRLSKNKFIRILQKLILINLTFILVFIICDYYSIQILSEVHCDSDGPDDDSYTNNTGIESQNSSSREAESSGDSDNVILKSEKNDNDEVYHFKIKKSTVDKIVDTAQSLSGVFASTVVPNIGAAAAAGTVGASVVKTTVGMPPLQRGVLIGGASAITAAGTVLGIDVGKSISKNLDLSESIKNSPHGDPDITRIPSPESDLINSPLEAMENFSPLEVLLNSLVTLNILELMLYIILILLLINKYFYPFNINNISKIINKFMPLSFINWYTKYTNKSIDYNNRFTQIMFISVTILLLLFKLGNLYITAELSLKIDDYVLVYNHLKNL